MVKVSVAQINIFLQEARNYWQVILSKLHKMKTKACTSMTNHIHCVLFFPDAHDDLNKMVGNAK
jgi:REP element-mobilizing transposase RayT